MPIEVRTHSRQWYKFVAKPHATSKKVLRLAFKELDIIEHETTISVVLADDSLLWELNLQYRKKNRPTNVLSFNYDTGTEGFCGEIFLSIDTIVREANEMGRSSTAHFAHMLLHGFLHIIGFTHDDTKNAALMQAKEIHLLSQLNVPNPYIC